MIRVYFVDDEPLALIGMQGILDWPALGYEVAGTARNGADALRAIESLRPDIVVTDIMMPVMDGLELAEACRKRDAILPVFIMLTSYDELDYVKRSIRIGAVEYLNKMELTAESLTAALERARAIVEKEAALRAPAGARSGDALAPYRERVFTQLYGSGFASRDALDHAMAQLGIRFDAPAYTVAIAALQCGDEPIERLGELVTGMARMAGEVLPSLLPCWVTGMDLRLFCALVPLDDPRAMQARLAPALEKTSDILQKYFGSPLYWSVGASVTDIMQISRSQQSAFDALPLLNAARPILFCGESAALDRGAQIVLQAREYIRRNLDKRLSLNDVAANFNFSPNYFSQLFTENSEDSFVEFVTAERVTAAKRLMAATDLKIYEISERVGFASPCYFSKVFKKSEGISPREYIKKVRNERT